jgi:hypothetical protein
MAFAALFLSLIFALLDAQHHHPPTVFDLFFFWNDQEAHCQKQEETAR